MTKPQLNFYTPPFRKSFCSRVEDGKSNFIFQFFTKFNEEGDYAEGWKELEASVIESLNSDTHAPIDGEITRNPKGDAGTIYRNGEPFILIRGWGNLTGIGAHNLPVETAAQIQDDFRDWLIYKLNKSEHENLPIKPIRSESSDKRSISLFLILLILFI